YGDTVSRPITLIDSTTGGATDTTKIIHGLINGDTYHFCLTAVDSAGFESEYSNEVVAIPDEFIYSMNIGWNIVSVPLTVRDYRKSALFPFASSSAFLYEGTYVIQDTLANGIGYWIELNNNQYVSMDGDIRTQDTIDVREGWNMVGSLSAPLATFQITSNPGDIETSQFFSYGKGYETTDTIMPGVGYWVKENQSGTLILSTGSSASLAKNAIASRIRIVPTSELPPPPPNADGTQNDLPKEFALDQNYPNPFNPTTTLRYALPTDSKVTLKIYNVLGQVVAALVDGFVNAGYQSAQWNASNVASGVYFYRIEAKSVANSSKSFTQVKKMVLVK